MMKILMQNRMPKMLFRQLDPDLKLIAKGTWYLRMNLSIVQRVSWRKP